MLSLGGEGEGGLVNNLLHGAQQDLQICLLGLDQVQLAIHPEAKWEGKGVWLSHMVQWGGGRRISILQHSLLLFSFDTLHLDIQLCNLHKENLVMHECDHPCA